MGSSSRSARSPGGSAHSIRVLKTSINAFVGSIGSRCRKNLYEIQPNRVGRVIFGSLTRHRAGLDVLNVRVGCATGGEDSLTAGLG